MSRLRLMWVLLGLTALTCVGLVALSPEAFAQSTGGSFGGGSFGGGGGGGGGGGFGGGGGSWGGGGYSGGGYSGGSYVGTGGSCDDPMSMLCTLGLFALFVVGPIVLKGISSGTRAYRHDDHLSAPTYHQAAQMDVSALMLGVDARSRRFIQERLDELARTGDTSTPGGLTHLLHETVTVLRRAERGWLYAGAYNTLPGTPQAAESKFRQVAADMRSRFRHELIRAADGGQRTREGPEMHARRDEGEGLVVVSVVVAARGEIPDISKASDRSHLNLLMRSFGAITPNRMVALEVIWSPAAENDRMSSAELESLYPELKKIEGVENVGRVVCTYCAFPYATEIQQCPNCGAPTSGGPHAHG